MAISEESRYHLYQRLEEVLGVEEATTLMEHLPPVGWADVATKRDLDALAVATKRDIDALAVTTKSEIDTLAVSTKHGIDDLKREIGVLASVVGHPRTDGRFAQSARTRPQELDLALHYRAHCGDVHRPGRHQALSG